MKRDGRTELAAFCPFLGQKARKRMKNKIVRDNVICGSLNPFGT